MSNFGHDSLRKIQEAQKNWERGPCLCFSKIIILPCKNASPTYWQERENVFSSCFEIMINFIWLNDAVILI